MHKPEKHQSMQRDAQLNQTMSLVFLNQFIKFIRFLNFLCKFKKLGFDFPNIPLINYQMQLGARLV